MYNNTIKNTPEYVLKNNKDVKYEIENQEQNHNEKRKKHVYKVYEKVMIKNNRIENKLDPRYLGPYTIINVNQNYVTVTDDYNNTAKLNLKNIKPYYVDNYNNLLGGENVMYES